MLAGAHRVLRIVTRGHGAAEQAAAIGKQPSMRQRRAWTRSVHRLLEPAARRYVYWWQAPLTRREVVWACRPALLAIAATLRDQRQPISATALWHLKTFLTDPNVSPLFGDNPITARWAAEQLRHTFIGHPPP